MFMTSKEMAEDMYAAMECRGFTGQYRVHNKFKVTCCRRYLYVHQYRNRYYFYVLGKELI